MPDIVVVFSKKPYGGQEFQGCSPSRHPRAKLPDDRHAQATIPAVLSNIQGLVAVVLADRQCQIGKQVDRKPRLIAQDIRNVLLRRWAENIDVELEHRIAESVGRFVV